MTFSKLIIAVYVSVGYDFISCACLSGRLEGKSRFVALCGVTLLFLMGLGKTR
jgi:hypothetical protein